MKVNITERQMAHQYGKYAAGMDNARQELKQAGKGNTIFARRDMADISKAGINALESKVPEKLSSVSPFSVMDSFEKQVSARKEKGVKSDAFECHVNQMASAYKQMRDDIEKKYADSGREKQYYIDNDGSVQELTQEKELEMLGNAYENHSKFMAVSTEIWSNLQGFKPQVIYGSGNARTEQTAKEDDARKGIIKAQAFEAFMSAIDNGNIKFLPRYGESLKDIRLDLAVTPDVRSGLNRIWDWQSRLH